MSHGTRTLAIRVLAGAALSLAIAACGSSSSPAASPAPASAAPSPILPATAAPPTAAPTMAPAASAAVVPPASPTLAATAPAEVLPSGALPSGMDIPIPSMHGDTALESQLPAELCGAATMKLSFAGEEFLNGEAGSGMQAFGDVLTALGKSPNDVSVAVAAVQSGECAGASAFALRIAGVPQDRFEQLFTTAQAKDTGVTPKRSNVGGHDVWAFADTDQKEWIYFKGDTAFGVGAADEAQAAKVLAALP
jgi:hypothetical protein